MISFICILYLDLLWYQCKHQSLSVFGLVFNISNIKKNPQKYTESSCYKMQHSRKTKTSGPPGSFLTKVLSSLNLHNVVPCDKLKSKCSNTVISMETFHQNVSSWIIVKLLLFYFILMQWQYWQTLQQLIFG